MELTDSQKIDKTFKMVRRMETINIIKTGVIVFAFLGILHIANIQKKLLKK